MPILATGEQNFGIQLKLKEIGTINLELQFSGPSFSGNDLSSVRDPCCVDSVEMEEILEDALSRDLSKSGSYVSSTLSDASESIVGSFSSQNLNSGSKRKISSRPGFFTSERTNLGIRELALLGKSFLNFGWNGISKSEFVSSLLLVQEYYQNFYSIPRDGCFPVENAGVLDDALYWLKFSTSAYGTAFLNYCNEGNGFWHDMLRTNSDLKTALSCLEIDSEDMLLWSTHGLFGNDIEMFKPKFFICHDKRSDAIVLSIRGSLV